MRLLILLTAALLTTACAGPSRYVASEYPIDNAKVASFKVKGEVMVSNGYQPNKANSVPVWDNKIPADLYQVTQVFAQQLQKEIAENGDTVSVDSRKTISVQVTNIYAQNRFAYTEGNISVKLTLGNGDVITVKKMNGSPSGMQKSLDGVINRAVIEVMANSDVQAYLRQ